MNLRRNRRTLASLFLGMWLFALFAGIASACLSDASASADQMSSIVGVPGHDVDHRAAPGCKEFCKTDTPVLSKLPVLNDPPVAPPLVLASPVVKGLDGATTRTRRKYLAHPPPDVPPLLRTLRFAL